GVRPVGPDPEHSATRRAAPQRLSRGSARNPSTPPGAHTAHPPTSTRTPTHPPGRTTAPPPAPPRRNPAQLRPREQQLPLRVPVVRRPVREPPGAPSLREPPPVHAVALQQVIRRHDRLV